MKRTVQKGRVQPVPEGDWLLGEVWVEPGVLWGAFAGFEAVSVLLTFMIHTESSRGPWRSWEGCKGQDTALGSLPSLVCGLGQAAVSEVQTENKLTPLAGLLLGWRPGLDQRSISIGGRGCLLV